MKKIINDPFAVVDEMLEGILLAHPGELRLVGEDRRAVVRADAPIKGKVGIATGGGSGHLPVFMGYVGKGLVDGCSIGNVFSSPTAEQMLAATKAIDGGAGVLYLFGNYSGDVMNFGMAAEMAEAEGIHVETVLASDDVASAPKGQESRRRGVAGIFYAYKLAGAKAETRASLEEVKRIAEKAIACTRSMGVALSPCTVPAAGRPTFSIGEDEMEIGMGIHGEPGVRRGKLEPADRIADILMEAILGDMVLAEGDEVSVLVNSLGATPQEELYILFRRVCQILSGHRVKVYRPYVGEYATSMEMAGCSVSLLKLDGELKPLLDAPALTPFIRQV
ncbi:MAG TPA: dihydroxyacetone kinase subunit DhaK [Candidatus Methylomirabilis sp.]|nr:dihydroxyacetone kinase subunit DhaK [Candidatus Methylomirabilis sp.]